MTKSTLIAFAAGAILTFIVTILVQNLDTGSKPVKHLTPLRHATNSPEFSRALGALFGTPLVSGNQVEILENGVEIFPSMLEAIRGAERSINFETYIYWSGDIADEFADALATKARNGVPVQVLLDWVGSAKMDLALIENMTDAGVVVERYKPPRWKRLDHFNSRTHRKLLVVDGRIGFTGGVGIGEEWTGDAEDPDHWRDLHFRIEGPVVAQLQSSFFDNWIETHRDVRLGNAYFPDLDPVGEVRAQAFISSPEEGSQSMQLLFLLAISSARERIQIATPYLVPDSLSRDALLDAAERGVTIQILVPGTKIDSELARHASRDMWKELLEAGIRIYEYQPTMYHAKLMVVDGVLASVGSTNFDNRSFRLNDEANLNVLDRELATQLEQVFAKDLQQTREVTLAVWSARPWHEKLREKLYSVFRSQL